MEGDAQCKKKKKIEGNMKGTTAWLVFTLRFHITIQQMVSKFLHEATMKIKSCIIIIIDIIID